MLSEQHQPLLEAEALFHRPTDLLGHDVRVDENSPMISKNVVESRCRMR
jgi:hypothetical protein